ncbi:kinesin-like protein KIF16B isoform X1 [Lissotriton helveticus]
MASVKVAVRVRPMNRREKDLEAKFIIEMDGNKTTIANLKMPDGVSGDLGRERVKTFTYDFSYFSAECTSPNFASQEMVFRNLGTDVLTSAFEGYNACVFAYGQTGSGKSYTMMGNPGDSGLIPRICEGLFSRIAETTRWGDASFRTEVSYLEIYNERVRDLLRRKSSKTFNLRVREHPKEGPYVEDLSKHLVQNYGDVEELMDAGNINRTTAATGMNDVSSRSHAIFTINFTQAKFDAEMPCETVSKIHLVDLAGSERADATGATGVRLKEGGNINKSLVTLGNVISALADLSLDAGNTLARKKQVFVPYRDSVLTWLLKDSLGGNSKTIMIATISPADINYGETLSTLRYANRAKNIINKPTINEDSNVKLIRELRAEIARLKALLAQGNQIALLDSPTALSMEEKLQQNEARVKELTKEWTNKWNETQNILKEQTLALRKEGIGVVLDSELPHLIGIDDDLLSTGIILYHLKEGRTYVGREDAATEQDIVLHGLDLESEHCIFENLDGQVTLIPLNEAQCSVNGIPIVESANLNQGAVILLGRTNMFRFNHPKEAAKLREKRKSGLLTSFSLSMTDLSKSCENLSTAMLYNPGLEFERQQREELEKLEKQRLLIKEMEEKQRSEKEELQKMQQEVEFQRKETEIVQLQIRKQEESLIHRSMDIESRLKDLLAEKEKFEEERLREQQEIEQQKKKQEEECFFRVHEELQNLQEIHNKEKAEKLEIFKELEKLKREKDEQYIKLESEKRRLEEQEKEQLKLVARLEEQLREKQEMIQLLKGGDVQQFEEEKKLLEDIREDLLKAKEARSEGEEDSEEVEKATHSYMNFKRTQLKQLSRLEADLVLQRDYLENDVAEDIETINRLKLTYKENLNLLGNNSAHALDATKLVEETEKIKQAEYRLQCKERQLQYLKGNNLPSLLEEKQRAAEVLDSGLLGLDNTLYQIEKEIEEKEEQLAQYQARSDQLQQLQESFEFTANIARQEEKVRKKEKEIIESKEKQQREALEQAVAKLERRHSALQRHSTIDLAIEEQKRKLASLNNSKQQAGLQASLEAEQKAFEEDRERLSQEIQQLKQKICESDAVQKGHLGTLDDKLSHTCSPNSPTKSHPPLHPLIDDRVNAFIEEEVQRRLQNLHHPYDDSTSLSTAHFTQSLKENETVQNGIVQRKLKYEQSQHCKSFGNAQLLPEVAGTYLDPAGIIADVTDCQVHEVPSKIQNVYLCSKRVISTIEKSDFSGQNQQECGQCGHDFGSLTETTLALNHVCTTHVYCRESVHFQSVSCSCLHVKQSQNKIESRCQDVKVVQSDHLTSLTERGSTWQKPSSEPMSCDNEQDQVRNIHSSTLLETNMLSKITSIESLSHQKLHGVSSTPHISEQQAQLDAQKRRSPGSAAAASEVEQTYSWAVLYSRISHLCKDTGNQLLNRAKGITQSKQLASVFDRSGKYVQALPLIRHFPFHRTSPLDVPSSLNQKQAESILVDKAKVYVCRSPRDMFLLTDEMMQYFFSQTSLDLELQDPCKVPLSCGKGLENGTVLRQPFVPFPAVFLELQEYPLQRLLEAVARDIPEVHDRRNELMGAYWLAVASCRQPLPQPACLLLFKSVMYVIVAPSCPEGRPLAVLHAVHRGLVNEVQVRFGGQGLRILGTTEDSLLTLLTFNQYFTQRLCHDVINSFLTLSDSTASLSHSLLTEDLMQLSLDWRAEVDDSMINNTVRLTCEFRHTLTDLVYWMHGNMTRNRAPLGEVQILMYMTVRSDEPGQMAYRSLVLMTNHVALMLEDYVFYPVPRSRSTFPPCRQFDRINLYCLSELIALVIKDQERFTKLDLIFSKKNREESGARGVLSPPHPTDHKHVTYLQSYLEHTSSRGVDVWKLTLSSTGEAIALIQHLNKSIMK